MAQNTTEAMDGQNATDYVPDDLDATEEEWFEATSPRVRLLVEDVYENRRDREVEVVNAGDVGVTFRTRWDGGCVGRDFFAAVEENGFQVADLNTGSGKILVRDRTKVED